MTTNWVAMARCVTCVISPFRAIDGEEIGGPWWWEDGRAANPTDAICVAKV
ncbi:MAG: hypothetical protein AAGA03_09045 [Planctomycetota bacterium]